MSKPYNHRYPWAYCSCTESEKPNITGLLFICLNVFGHDSFSAQIAIIAIIVFVFMKGQARAVESLVRAKMQHREFIILCLEDCSDWSNATTRRVVMQVCLNSKSIQQKLLKFMSLFSLCY